MRYKLKYSSLLSFKKKNNSILHVRGPLGKNTIKVPSTISFLLNNEKQTIIFHSKTFRNNKKVHLYGFLSTFSNSCRTLVFGDLIGLNITGLGLKLLGVSTTSPKERTGFLSMNLGYSDTVNHFIDYNRSLLFFQNNRNILFYSTDYSFIRNQVFRILWLKKPGRYKKKGFTLVDIII